MEQTSPSQNSCITSIFINDEPRLRAGWRLIIQTILIIFFISCVIFPAVFVPALQSGNLGLLYLQVVMLFGTTLSIFLARRFLDKRSFVSLGLKLDGRALLDLLVGFIITFFMMGVIFSLEWVAGWLTFDSFAWEHDATSTLLAEIFIILITYLLVGWNEELLSRGYHLQTLSSGLNKFWGVALSSAVFGVMHLGNPNSDSTFFVATGIFLAGVFLAFGYLRTRQLWLSIGLHIGWNFFQGTVFGFPVSGTDSYRLTRISVNGPELWTGGPFGPEAGLIVIPGLILGAALIYAYTRNCLKNEDDALAGLDNLDNSLLPE